MANDPVLYAYAVKRLPSGKSAWTKIGAAFPHERGNGLTVCLDAVPFDGRVVLLELSDSAERIGEDGQPVVGTSL